MLKALGRYVKMKKGNSIIIYSKQNHRNKSTTVTQLYSKHIMVIGDCEL